MHDVDIDNIEVTNADLDKLDAYLEKRNKHKDWRRLHSKLAKGKELDPERVAGLEWEAWHQRTMGRSVQHIAQAMNVSTGQVNLWLQDAMAQAKSKTSDLIELQRELDLERTEILIEKYLPLALIDEVIVTKIKNGEPITVVDLEAPRKNAYFVAELLKLRCKIRGDVPPEQLGGSSVDVTSWLHTQKEFISKAVKDAPRDVLTLEVENPIDETTTTINGAT